MSTAFKQLLEKVTTERNSGPSPTFSVIHLIRTLDLIGEETAGRNKLAESLGIGEGAIRTIISRLRDANLITTSQAGCSLTSKGQKLWQEYRSTLRQTKIGKNELSLAEHNVAILIRKHGHRIRSGMEQRDAAIIAGANSATSMVFRKGQLIIPSVSDDVSKDFPRAAKQILTLLKPEDGDAVIIGGASNLEKAQHGALAAAWSVLDC